MRKILFLILMLNLSLQAKKCSNEFFQNHNEFKYKEKMMKIFNHRNHQWEDKLGKDLTLFPKCTMDNHNLFMYLYRGDLPDKLLIQFIFKSSNNNFSRFADDIVETLEFQTAIRNIKTKKKNIELEISTNEHCSKHYIIKDGIIVSSHVVCSYEK